ncbi:MAG TPA: ShlB/FhaC/HecB family hemolysin secretion/activation protein, partial [Gammaproteobacteria bacterium]|nr:ShlB/FhaC/HecB family hemolysin secretion/activation protein [Gammaproteobacteria bacterium]
ARTGRAVRIIFLACSLCASASWAQEGIPPAATNGGVQPQPPAALPPGSVPVPFAIPRVPDRPLGIDAGPRVKVQRFELVGAATQPDVPAAEIDAALKAALSAEPAAGYTVNQLQEVAAHVADVYRKHGMILAQAVVPAQDVYGGAVDIMVLGGALGDIRFEGQKMYSRKTLMAPFRPLLGRPVHKDEIESALLYLTDYPGLTAFGVFQSGERVGTTDLVVKTQREDRFTLDTNLDNQGSQFSGQYRATLGFTVNDPLGRADRLKIYVLDAFDPADNDAKGLYGGLDYQLPLFGPVHALKLGLSRNLFDVGQHLRQLGIKGTTDIAQAGYTWNLSKTRLGGSSLGFSFAHKDAEFEQQHVTTADDVLSVGGLSYQWQHIGVRTRGVTQFSVDYSHGFAGLFGALESYDRQQGLKASRFDAGGQFDKLAANVQRYQRLTTNQALLLRMSGQYSGDVLVSLEQLSIGGPDTVRAYPMAEFLADKAGFASAEWIIDAPGFAKHAAFGGHTWGQIFQLSVFADYAKGWLTEALPGQASSVDLSGWGIGLQLNVPSRFFARLDLAAPLGKEDPSNGRDPQYFFRFGITR